LDKIPIEKQKLAEVSFNKRQKAFLDLHGCDFSEKKEVKEVIIRAVKAVAPLNITEFKAIATDWLSEEPTVVERLSVIKPDDDTRRRLVSHLVDATFARCLTDCVISL